MGKITYLRNTCIVGAQNFIRRFNVNVVKHLLHFNHCADVRVCNHPDLGGTVPILTENPES